MKEWSRAAEAYRRSFARACGGAVMPLLEATSGADDGLRHLDVGCGDGRLAAAALAQGRVVTTCDADADMCALTSASTPGLPVHRAALPDLPYDTGSFDVVTANFVINHVDDPLACVQEMVRVCAAGGVVAGTVWPASPPVSRRPA